MMNQYLGYIYAQEGKYIFVYYGDVVFVVMIQWLHGFKQCGKGQSWVVVKTPKTTPLLPGKRSRWISQSWSILPKCGWKSLTMSPLVWPVPRLCQAWHQRSCAEGGWGLATKKSIAPILISHDSIYIQLGQVKKFWRLMVVSGVDSLPTKVKLHADAWGVRKLISHSLRSLRLSREPRELSMHWLIKLCLVIYGGCTLTLWVP